MRKSTIKRACISLGIIAIILLSVSCACLSSDGNTENAEYLRIHVRANSNSEEDQRVKYLVKDGIVEAITPLVAEITSKEESVRVMTEQKERLEAIADGILSNNGFSYKCEIVVRNEKFPTRVYDGVTLKSGYYDALIVNLGKAEGDNWWCVVYPPLCFGNAKPVYRSKIAEIIAKFKRRAR